MSGTLLLYGSAVVIGTLGLWSAWRLFAAILIYLNPGRVRFVPRGMPGVDLAGANTAGGDPEVAAPAPTEDTLGRFVPIGEYDEILPLLSRERCLAERQVEGLAYRVTFRGRRRSFLVTRMGDGTVVVTRDHGSGNLSAEGALDHQYSALSPLQLVQKHQGHLLLLGNEYEPADGGLEQVWDLGRAWYRALGRRVALRLVLVSGGMLAFSLFGGIRLAACF